MRRADSSASNARRTLAKTLAALSDTAGAVFAVAFIAAATYALYVGVSATVVAIASATGLDDLVAFWILAFGALAVFAVVTFAVFAVLAFQENLFPRLQGLSSMMVRHVIRQAVGPVEGGGLRASAGWRAMRAISRLMPRAAGRRWLAEAESFLTEAPPVLLRGAIPSYLIGAAQVIAVSWAGHLARRTRLTKSGQAPR